MLLRIVYKCGSAVPPKIIFTNRIKVLGTGDARVLVCTDRHLVKHSINLRRIISIQRKEF